MSKTTTRSKRRDQLLIFIEILGALTAKIKITHLIREMGLSHTYISKYLEKMNMMGLIEVKGTEYGLSEKGWKVFELIGDKKCEK